MKEIIFIAVYFYLAGFIIFKFNNNTKKKFNMVIVIGSVVATIGYGGCKNYRLYRR